MLLRWWASPAGSAKTRKPVKVSGPKQRGGKLNKLNGMIDIHLKILNLSIAKGIIRNLPTIKATSFTEFLSF